MTNIDWQKVLFRNVILKCRFRAQRKNDQKRRINELGLVAIDSIYHILAERLTIHVELTRIAHIPWPVNRSLVIPTSTTE